MPSTQETQLRIRQTLDVDPEINFINWELNIQDVAAATARSVHARGLLSLVLNPTQWDTHVSNISTDAQGQNVIAQRYSPPEFTEITAEMSPTEITVSKMRNKTRDDWMIAEQNLKLAIMDSVGETIRHIIAPPPLSFQNMTISNIIEEVRNVYETTTRHTVRRIKEILAEKLDNVRNLRTHVAKMRNAFTISTSAGIPVDEFRCVELLRDSIIGHHQMVKILMDYDHDFPELQSHTFARMSAYLELHLPNVVSHDDATKAHGLSTQINEKPGDEILLSMNAAQVTAYLALQDEVKKLRKHRNKNNRKRQNRKSEENSNSDDETDRTNKKHRKNDSKNQTTYYCWCHGTQRSHTSQECKVMEGDKGRFTTQMRNATKSTSPPGGSTRRNGMDQNE